MTPWDRYHYHYPNQHYDHHRQQLRLVGWGAPCHACRVLTTAESLRGRSVFVASPGDESSVRMPSGVGTRRAVR